MSALLKETAQPAVWWALQYARTGWAVLPIRPGEKTPLISNWQDRATTEPAMIREWWARMPRAGIAIHCVNSGLVVVDVDPRNGGNATLAKIEAAQGPLWGTGCLMARTAGSGSHYVFRAPEGMELPHSLGPGLDLLHGNHYFIVAPSIGPSGKAYEWDQGPFDADALAAMPVLPDWLQAAAHEQAAPRQLAYGDAENDSNALSVIPPQLEQDTPENNYRIASMLEAMSPDVQYPDWFAWLCAIHSTGLSNARKIADRWSQGSGKYDSDAFARAWDSIKTDRARTVGLGSLHRAATAAGWIDQRTLPPQPDRPDGGREDATDAGNANMLVRLSDGNLRFLTERKEFMHWDGKTWTTGAAGSSRARTLALSVGEAWLDKAKASDIEAERSAGEDDRGRLRKVASAHRAWARVCRSKKGIDAMVTLASNDGRMILSASELDRNPWQLGAANGVINLLTGTLDQAARDDYVTKRTAYAFDPEAKALRWEQLIDEVTGLPDGQGFTPRPEMAAHLHRVMGYCCTGSTREQTMLIPVGNGGNGKNIVLDEIQRALGGYALTLQPENLMAKKGDLDGERSSPVMASLAGIRLAISSESRDGSRLDVSLVKRHTGGGFMTARANFQSPVTFEMSHKLVLMTNHLPGLDHMDDAIRGRIQILPFDRTWNRPGHSDPDPSLPDGDPKLGEGLKAEGPGILAWLVRGCIAWQRGGLKPPEVVVAKTMAYLGIQGHLGRWLDGWERCDPKGGTPATELFEKYLGML